MRGKIHRRQILAISATGMLAGCFGPINSSCTTAIPGDLSDELVDRVRVGSTSNNANNGGDCNRRSSAFCLEVSLTVAPEVHAVEGRTPDGETIVSHEVQNESVENLQLAEFEPNGGVEREIVLLDDDGRELDSATVTSECEADYLLSD